MTQSYSGRCLCGDVRFEIAAISEPPVACHCRECQRQGGGVWVAVTARRHDVEIAGHRLAWVSATPRAWRGFCRDCGSYLFWQETDSETIDIAFGCIDNANGLELSAHIFVEEARLPIPEDGIPRFARGRPGID